MITKQTDKYVRLLTVSIGCAQGVGIPLTPEALSALEAEQQTQQSLTNQGVQPHLQPHLLDVASTAADDTIAPPQTSVLGEPSVCGDPDVRISRQPIRVASLEVGDWSVVYRVCGRMRAKVFFTMATVLDRNGKVVFTSDMPYFHQGEKGYGRQMRISTAKALEGNKDTHVLMSPIGAAVIHLTSDEWVGEILEYVLVNRINRFKASSDAKTKIAEMAIAIQNILQPMKFGFTVDHDSVNAEVLRSMVERFTSHPKDPLKVRVRTDRTVQLDTYDELLKMSLCGVEVLFFHGPRGGLGKPMLAFITGEDGSLLGVMHPLFMNSAKRSVQSSTGAQSSSDQMTQGKPEEHEIVKLQEILDKLGVAKVIHMKHRSWNLNSIRLRVFLLQSLLEKGKVEQAASVQAESQVESGKSDLTHAEGKQVNFTDEDAARFIEFMLKYGDYYCKLGADGRVQLVRAHAAQPLL